MDEKDKTEVGEVFSNFQKGIKGIVKASPSMKTYTDRLQKLVANRDKKGIQKLQKELLAKVNEIKALTLNDKGNKS